MIHFWYFSIFIGKNIRNVYEDSSDALLWYANVHVLGF